MIDFILKKIFYKFKILLNNFDLSYYFIMEPFLTITIIGMAAKSIIVYMAVSDRMPLESPQLYRGHPMVKPK